MAETTKTMSEVRKVAAAIGWSAETLAFAWQQAGIGIVPEPKQAPWEAAYADWLRGKEHDSFEEIVVWKAAVDWCVGQIWAEMDGRPASEGKAYLALDKARRRIRGEGA